MEAERRLLRTPHPLSDITNTRSHPRAFSQSSASTASVVKSSKGNPSFASKKSVSKCKHTSTTPFTNVPDNASSPTPLPSSVVSTPSRSLNSSSFTDTIDRDVSEPVSVVYGRRCTSVKRSCDNAANPSFLLPSVVSTPTGLPKISSVGGNSDRDLSEPTSVVCRRRHTSDKRKSKEMAVAIPFRKKPMERIFYNGEKSNNVEGVGFPKSSTVPCRKKHRAMLSEQSLSKNALLQDYIDKQKAYFKEVDEYELPVEEVESVEELD